MLCIVNLGLVTIFGYCYFIANRHILVSLILILLLSGIMGQALCVKKAPFANPITKLIYVHR